FLPGLAGEAHHQPVTTSFPRQRRFDARAAVAAVNQSAADRLFVTVKAIAAGQSARVTADEGQAFQKRRISDRARRLRLQLGGDVFELDEVGALDANLFQVVDRALI